MTQGALLGVDVKAENFLYSASSSALGACDFQVFASDFGGFAAPGAQSYATYVSPVHGRVRLPPADWSVTAFGLAVTGLQLLKLPPSSLVVDIPIRRERNVSLLQAVLWYCSVDDANNTSSIRERPDFKAGAEDSWERLRSALLDQAAELRVPPHFVQLLDSLMAYAPNKRAFMRWAPGGPEAPVGANTPRLDRPVADIRRLFVAFDQAEQEQARRAAEVAAASQLPLSMPQPPLSPALGEQRPGGGAGSKRPRSDS